MMNEYKARDQILIAGLTPHFLEKPVLWFDEHFSKIKAAAQTQSWWQRHALFLERDQAISFSHLLRRLDELGYEKVQKISSPGEFSHFGGSVEVFPINAKRPLRITFFGNRIEEILFLPFEASNEAREKIIKQKTRRALGDLLKNLMPGDYVVHMDHGIGIYRGTTMFGGSTSKHAEYLEIEPQNTYYVIEYAAPKQGADPDRLYVPESQHQKIDRYVGFVQPNIHRLGGELWLKTKRRIREDIEKFARELLEVYAKREISNRPAYPPDDRVQKEFERSFEHIETGDQLNAIQEIKKDMESEHPMDRLICGDVGFGKTEVALRAAFKAAWSGKQVAVLCPTTILADQHFQTFQERLKSVPIRLAVLSRFESEHNQRETVRRIADGTIDIVIGTHRLLSADVGFKRLGILIIDEEQKFGVRQKEKLKALRNEVDILSLSATPIPRTLQLALSGMRSLSVISSPPPGRQSIETHILPYSKEAMKKAIERELARKGQVYVLHNRVETIGKATQNLSRLIPNAAIVSAHGKMREEELRRVMNDFREKKNNVLVATTIIENGLDLPSVNTLVVTNCAKLGLAQSYQIRGRVGRSHEKAFAYFFYNEQKLEGKALKRLEALRRAEALGSGYSLALDDLEIRGAGNILGKEQSGNINQIGLNLYCHMLSEAVERMKLETYNL